MDQSTHEVRRDYWFDIVTRCSQRPDGCTVRQWLAESGIMLSRKLNEAIFVRLFCVKTDAKLNITAL